MEEQNQNLNQPEQIQPGVQQQQQPPVQAMIHTNHVPMQQFNQGASQPNAGPSQPSYQQGQPTFGQSSSFAPQQNYASQQGGRNSRVLLRNIIMCFSRTIIINRSKTGHSRDRDTVCRRCLRSLRYHR